MKAWSEQSPEMWQEMGRQARRRGCAQRDNPFLTRGVVAARTEEAIREWEARYLGWDCGWLLEDALLDRWPGVGPTPITTPGRR